MNLPIFTIGHSTRSVDEFVELLKAADASVLADIRAFPGSRANPQFNKDVLPDAMAAFDISYEHVAALGGRRRNRRSVPPEVNAYWTNESFHNYADYALSEQFRAGLDHLVALGRERRCVMMCSEAVWWRCHRRIVADHLIARGETVVHIMGTGRLDPARLNAGAVIAPDGLVVYPGGHHVRLGADANPPVGWRVT